MADGNIQIGLGNGHFCFHDIPIPVVAFLNHRFRFGIGAGRYGVHLPKYIGKNLFFRIVHRGDFLRVVRVVGGFHRINRKHLFPDCAGAGHLQHIIGVGSLGFVQFVLVLGIDFLHNALHGHAASAVLTGKENPKAGADNHGDQADNDNHQNSDPAPGCNGGNQRLCPGDDRFHRQRDCLGNSLCCNCRSFSGSAGGMSRSPCRPCGSLRCFLRCLCRLLGGLDRGLGGALCGFYRFPCSLYRPFSGGFCSLLNGFAAPVYGFNGFLGVAGGAPDTFSRLAPRLFFGLVDCPFFKEILCFGNILFGGLYTFAALPVKFTHSFLC